MVAPIIDEHDAIFGLKGFKNFATSWAFRSFSCTYRCLDVLKVSLVKPNWWRFSGRWWRFHVLIFHDISCQSFVWSILHIFVNVCFFLLRLYFSPQKSYVRFLPTMTERRIDPDDGVASLGSILVILSDTAADVFVPFSLPCWGIPGKIFQRTILESCLAEHIQKTSWSIRCPWISLHDLNMVWRLDSTRHRGIRKRPSKHTGRSARSRKVDPTCWTIAWMIGDGLGDKNHMESPWTGHTKKVEFAFSIVTIFNYFPCISPWSAVFFRLFVLPNLFRFHYFTTGKKAKAAPKAKVRVQESLVWLLWRGLLRVSKLVWGYVWNYLKGLHSKIVLLEGFSNWFGMGIGGLFCWPLENQWKIGEIVLVRVELLSQVVVGEEGHENTI